MKNKLIAAVVAAGLVLPVVAHAEATLYGSIRAGLVSGDDDGADSGNRLDLGATGNDGGVGGQGLYSRIGVKANNDLGNGMSAGLTMERGVGDTLSVRHTNVWLSGAWGKLTLGQQGNPYRNARKWDQTWFTGGQFGSDGGSRIEGLQYSLSSNNFSFSVMAEANDAVDDEAEAVDAETTTIQYYHTATPTATGYTFTPITDMGVDRNDGVNNIATGYAGAVGFIDGDGNFVTADPDDDDDVDAAFIIGGGTNDEAPSDPTKCSGISATCAAGYAVTPPATDAKPDGGDVAGNSDANSIRDGAFSRTRIDKAGIPAESNDGVDSWTVTAGYDFGPVNLDVSHRSISIDNVGFDNTAVGINGSVGPVGWYLAWQQAEDNTAAENDVDSIGGFASFGFSENDTAYLYHVSHSADEVEAFGSSSNGESPTETVLGYSHSFGGGLSFIAEYLDIDKDTDADGSEPNVLILAMKVDF